MPTDAATLLTWLQVPVYVAATAALAVVAYRYYSDTRDEIAYLRQRIEALEKDCFGKVNGG